MVPAHTMPETDDQLSEEDEEQVAEFIRAVRRALENSGGRR